MLRIAEIGLAALVLGLSAVELRVIRAGHRDESAQPADAVIVLGAGVIGTTPSVALQTRIAAAERYLKAHPDIPDFRQMEDISGIAFPDQGAVRL